MTGLAMSFRESFTTALRGVPFHVEGLHGEPVPLPAGRWSGPADADDRAMLQWCDGPTLDVGCGPGRMAAALAEAGQVVLGIDIVREAVSLTRGRGAAALERDVFDKVPAEGRWHVALLADGNVGIGGDPVMLLRRMGSLIHPRGRVVVELAGPGTPASSSWATLVSRKTRSRPFRWAVVGVDDIAGVASQAGLAISALHQVGERWCAVLAHEKVSVL